VKESTFYLKKLKEDSKNDLVFPAPRDDTKPMGKELPAMWLGRISERVLGRRVYPYILRHSRATELYTNSGIPDKTAQKFLGHSKSMGDVYTHLSNKDVKEAVSNTIYRLEDIAPEKKHQIEIDIEGLKKNDKIMADKIMKLAELLQSTPEAVKILKQKQGDKIKKLFG